MDNFTLFSSSELKLPVCIEATIWSIFSPRAISLAENDSLLTKAVTRV